jgi:cytoskeleton protein RodZ
MTDLLSPDAEDLADTAERLAVRESEAEHPPWTSVPEEPEADEVVVRRNGRVSVTLAAVSAVLAAAYFARAVTEFGHVVDWILCTGLTALTWAHVFSFLDSRMPLLVADSHGVRIRLGRTWRGMAWDDLEEVEYAPRRRVFRDGRLVLFPRNVDRELAMLGPAGRRHARLTDRMFGAPFAMPLGLTTRVLGARGDLAAALVHLAAGRCEIVEVVPGAADDTVDTGDTGDTGDIGDIVDEGDPDDGEQQELPEVVVPPAAVVASPAPLPQREVRPAVRAELTRDREWDSEATQSVDLPAIPHATTKFVIDDLADLETVDPVIGPELKASRERLRLSVDQLAARTRIRPHVIEAIEIDDFAPCGGDFYARGHLRTLARVLGVDVAPLLKTYDDTYADAPIDPRRVFEAELATGRHGSIRGVRGGPNWWVIVAAVMTVVLAWSVARLVMDHPSTVSPASPSLADGSAGLTSATTHAAARVPVELTAAGGGAHVVVRDGTGKVVFTGSLAFGQSRTLQVSPPVRIQTTDGSLEVSVDGDDHGSIGRTGQPAQDVYTAR